MILTYRFTFTLLTRWFQRKMICGDLHLGFNLKLQGYVTLLIFFCWILIVLKGRKRGGDWKSDSLVCCSRGCYLNSLPKNWEMKRRNYLSIMFSQAEVRDYQCRQCLLYLLKRKLTLVLWQKVQWGSELCST